MEHGKEYYKGIIRVIEYLDGKYGTVTAEKGQELAGNYWPEIARVFKETYHAGTLSYGEFHASRPANLAPLLEDCKHMVAAIDKAEDDRNVDRKYKIKGILYGRISLIISSLAFLLSLWTVLRQAGIF